MIDWQSLRRECALWEDANALAVNKPSGVSVVGERHSLDLVQLAAETGERLYPAHRIDKATSGVILFAKKLEAHGGLTRQFNKRTVDKAYLAVTDSTGLPEAGTIELPLSVGRKNRVRVAAPRESITVSDGCWSVPSEEVFVHVKSYPSTTRFTKVWESAEQTLLAVRPESGRRHQIRVHLAWIGHAIAADPLYDKHRTGRTLLHAWRLGFDAPWLGGRRIDVEAAPGDDFWSELGELDSAAVLRRARDSFAAWE